MKKLIIIMLMLGFIGQAQTFDFNCDPIPIPLRVVVLLPHTVHNANDALLVYADSIEPVIVDKNKPIFLDDVEGTVISGQHFQEQMIFIIGNISAINLQKLKDKFSNNEPILLRH